MINTDLENIKRKLDWTNKRIDDTMQAGQCEVLDDLIAELEEQASVLRVVWKMSKYIQKLENLNE